MSSARKLPSGKWMVRKYLYRDADGKDHYKAFTADTRKEAEMKASAYAAKEHSEETGLYVKDAIRKYIDANAEVLSPTTIRAYNSYCRTHYDDLSRYKVSGLTNLIVQGWISALTRSGLSPKTIKNAYGLLSAATKAIDPDKQLRVKLPKIAKREKYAPSDADIDRLINSADGMLRRAMILGSYSMRRSEVCGVKYGDLDGNRLHVHAVRVRGDDGWVLKPIPKTEKSERYVYLGEKALAVLGEGDPGEFIVSITPGAMSARYEKHRRKCGLPRIRFHDLRGYFASISAVLEIPDTYTASMGGWESSGATMKKVYQNKIADMADYYSKKVSRHLDGLIKEEKGA